MARQSTQHKLDRVRPPRVQITYDVEIGDAIEVKELPFVMGVLGDFTGNADGAAAAAEGPQIRGGQSRQLRQVLESMKPHLAFAVENKLSEDPDAPKLKVDLHFKSMDDFEPENGGAPGESAARAAGSARPAFGPARQPAGQRQAGRVAARMR